MIQKLLPWTLVRRSLLQANPYGFADAAKVETGYEVPTLPGLHPFHHLKNIPQQGDVNRGPRECCRQTANIIVTRPAHDKFVGVCQICHARHIRMWAQAMGR